MAKKKDQGYTMIIVMCLMFLFMALALSMLFSSALLLARAERAAAQKQSRASAISFTEWMEAELRVEPSTDPSDGKPSNLSAQIEERLKNNWPAYTGGIGHEESVAVLVFTPTGETATATFPANKFGDVEVRMYWEAEDGGTDPKGADTNLVVTVKVVVRGEQYSVTTRYEKDGADSSDPREWKGWTGKWNVVGRE